MLPNIVEILSKMTPKSVQKGSKIAPGAARRRPKSLQGVPPRRFREPGRKKRTSRAGVRTPTGTQNGSQNRYFGEFWCNFRRFLAVIFWLIFGWRFRWIVVELWFPNGIQNCSKITKKLYFSARAPFWSSLVRFGIDLDAFGSIGINLGSFAINFGAI